MKKTLLASLINHIPHAIFWKDCKLIFQGCNLEFAQQFGYDNPDEVIGKTDYDFPFPPHLIEQYRQDDLAIMQSGIPKLNYEESQVQPNGEVKTVLVSKVPFFNEAHEVIGLLGIYSDISERKALEQSLKLAKEQAEAANQAKNAFIANMSHDIRTPLAGIIGMANLLKEDNLPPDAHQKAQWLLDSGEQLLGLLNDVLNLIAADYQAENHVHYQWFDLNACLQSLIELEMPAIKVKQLAFQCEIDKATPLMIYTDKVKLHRLLLNLLSNAIKFTEKGSIAIDVHAFKKQESSSYQFVFRVKDTGCGMAAAHLEKIFDRFYRITPSYQGVHDGYGIGLHVVKQYCEALGGELDVESQEGYGSTFTAIIPAKAKDLPIKPYEEVKLVSVKPLTNPSLVKILLVEDNLIALRTLETLVKHYPCNSESATTGLSALELATQYSFDLILTDIGLPDISGIELTKRLRLLERQQHKSPLPIIGLTAHAQQDIEAEAIAAGMQAVFTKPITVNLLKEIMTWLPANSVSSSIKTPTYADNSRLDCGQNNLEHLDAYLLLDEKAGIAQTGNQMVWLELLEVFAQQLNEERPCLQHYYNNNDWNALTALAHKLKSSALYCGADRLKKACLALEHYHRDTQDKARKTSYFILLHVMDETHTAIMQRLEIIND